MGRDEALLVCGLIVYALIENRSKNSAMYQAGGDRAFADLALG